ncbi:glucokinase [Candidatus Aalborgicola defluviihabitans]|uniref:glucokinase n=1 Tax=Candidatus Aalborgicola defluviihabitans TaxID=3386187 RepID=UPI001EB0FE47|nr:glucokinase [Burkholderiales bacterium]
MNQGYPRLLGDIGGTNARWAWQESAGADLEDISVQPCEANASLQDSASSYLLTHGRKQPRWACIGIAAAVTGDAVHMTNSSWRFSISEFKEALGLERCLVINDFTALALSLPALKPVDLRAVGGGVAMPGAAIALLGPGTGLGISGLVRGAGGGYTALSGEGGHATLAAMDAQQAQLLGILRQRFSHVSAERVLSGAGLVNLYQALCTLHGCATRDLQPADVTDCAIAASDEQCVQTVRYFTQFLGGIAGNLALTLGALGGVYIGGGIVPRLGVAFDEALFRQSFEDKGRYRQMLVDIPVWVITASTPALVGASCALDSLIET